MKILTQIQLMDLVIKGYTTIDDQRLYFKAKTEEISHAHKLANEDEELFFGGEFCFVLTPHYKEMRMERNFI